MVMHIQEKSTVETLQATGTQILDTVKNLVHEGNVRKITVKQAGRTIAEFPLTFGVLGAALAPALAAIAAIVALANDCTIEIEHVASEPTA